MSEIAQVVLLTAAAGGAIPLGGFLARIENLHPAWLGREFRHGVLAFGGGALLAAVALVLVPDGIDKLPGWRGMSSLMVGGVAFMGLDVLLNRFKTPASQLAATLADFLPEAAALGASCATGGTNTLLLAMLIALQNLPEGFNAYRELRHGGFASKPVLVGFGVVALLGPGAGVVGFGLLAQSPAAVGFVMLFASGGILYLMFQDIAPQTKLRNFWAPPLGAVLGFAAGLLGHIVLHG